MESIKNKKCTIEGCEGKHVARGLCNKHYHEYKQQKKLKPCACGCGALTSYTYKHGHHTRLFSSEEQSRRGRMNNGDKLRFSGEGKGYVKVNQRHEHRTVAECMLGRKLKSDEIVHHVNRNKRDNRPENLEVLNRREHILEHLEEMKNAKAKKLSAKNV